MFAGKATLSGITILDLFSLQPSEVHGVKSWPRKYGDTAPYVLYAATGGRELGERSTAETLLRFECTQCGACCTVRGDYAHVYVDEQECGGLAEFLSLTRQDLERRFTFVDEDGWRQLRFEQGRCVFLDAENRCGVYSARPTQCRTFPFWPELIRRGRWTGRARRLCEGLGRGTGFSAREVGERLERARQAESDS